MIWRIVVIGFLATLSLATSLTVGCHSDCKACTSFNDSSACLSCTKGILVLVNNDYGYCSTKTCSDLSGLSYTETSTNVSKCFIGGYCPSNYYHPVGESRCAACDKSCSDCFGPNSTDCLTCPSGKLLNISDNAFGGNCIDTSKCNATILGSNAICGNSTVCDSTCGSCIGTKAEHCTVCKDATQVLAVKNSIGTLSWGPCLTSLSMNRDYYAFGISPNVITSQYKCHWTCQACVAENDRFACTACSDNAYLNVISELNGAPVGNCKPTCANSGELSLKLGKRNYCSGSGACPLNSTGKVLKGNGTCSVSQACDISCGLCEATGSADCLSCSNWGDWLKMNTNATTGTCAAFSTTGANFTAYGKLVIYPAECSAPYTKANGTMCISDTCKASNCAICGSTDSLCWKCSSGYSLQTSSKSNVEGTCVSKCVDGYFQTTDQRCIKCHDSCASCTEGLAPDKCQTCVSGKVLSGDAPASCASACPTGLSNRGGVCRSSGPTPIDEGVSSGTPGWYIGAIIIGVFSMLSFYGFVTYIVIDWRKGLAPAASEPKEVRKEPEAAEQKKEEKKAE